MLSLQCGKATAVFVSSRDRDFVAEVGKCGSRLLDSFFLSLWLSVFFTALPSMSSTRTYENFFFNLVRCNAFFWLYSSTAVKHTVFFLSTSLFFFKARLKPIAASATLIKKVHRHGIFITLEYLPCLYTRAHGES